MDILYMQMRKSLIKNHIISLLAEKGKINAAAI